MLELPEVVTIARQMNAELRGKEVVEVIRGATPHKFAWHSGTQEEYTKWLVGKKVGEVQARGGYIVAAIEPDYALLFGDMGGRLLYQHDVKDAAINPPPIQILGKKGRTKKTFTRNLLERFELYNDGVLRFIQNKIVPFDSNLAERDIRMMKVKIKISREFRDKSTAKAVILIRSYISIIRKNGIRVIEAIASAFKNNPWIPEKDKMKHMRKAEC